MAIALKGQNLRIFANGIDSNAWSIIGMATNCTITLTNNTEDGSTKDDSSMASKPVITDKSWSVQVDSLNVLDAGILLTKVKTFAKVMVMWDKVRADATHQINQLPSNADYARVGYAYINDLTLNFNDRENSAKQVQLTGCSPLETQGSSLETDIIGPGSFSKGQFVRLFLGSDNTTTPAKVIAAAKQLSMHVSVQLENNTTKDTDGGWQLQEPTGISYDITSNALVKSADTITSAVAGQELEDIVSIYEAGTPVKWQITNVSGDNQRTKGTVLASGSALLTQLSISAQNRAVATYNAQLTGYGDYTVGA